MRPWHLVLSALVTLASGCQRPEPPTLTPRSAKLTGLSPTQIEIAVELDAYNPNAIALSARSMSAKVTLAHRYEVGTVKVATPLELPSHKTTRLGVPLTLKWKDLTALGALAVGSGDVPYDVDGTVELGGESLSVDMPFQLSGTITHEQLVEAALGSLPKGLLPSLR